MLINYDNFYDTFVDFDESEKLCECLEQIDDKQFYSVLDAFNPIYEIVNSLISELKEWYYNNIDNSIIYDNDDELVEVITNLIIDNKIIVVLE